MRSVTSPAPMAVSVYWPFAFVRAMSTLDVADTTETSAPASGRLFVESATCPRMIPPARCADAGIATETSRMTSGGTSHRTVGVRFDIGPPEVVRECGSRRGGGRPRDLPRWQFTIEPLRPAADARRRRGARLVQSRRTTSISHGDDATRAANRLARF